VEVTDDIYDGSEENDVYISGITRKGGKWEHLSIDFSEEDYTTLEIVKE